MAWTSPHSWTPLETVTSGLLNTHLRDNLNVLKTWIRDSGSFRTMKFAKSDTGVQNSGTGETDATGHTFSIGAGELATSGDGYDFHGYGQLAANGSTKTLRLDIAGQKTIIMQTTQNGGWYKFRFNLSYYSATALRFLGNVELTTAPGLIATSAQFTLITSVTSLNMAIAQTLKMTLQGSTGTGDIVLFQMLVATALIGA